MIGSLEDLTALIAAIGVLVGAFGTSVVRVGKCLSDLRRKKSTATATKREVVNDQVVTAEQVDRDGDTVQTLKISVRDTDGTIGETE